MLARYMIELSLVEYKMIKYPPLKLAVSAIYFSFKLFKIPSSEWKDKILCLVNYTESELRECAKDLCYFLQKASESNY